MKNFKFIALVGLMVGATSVASAQALTSATTNIAENPFLVGMGANLGTVQVSSTQTTSLTLQIPGYRQAVGVPLCTAFDSAGQGPKPLKFTFISSTGVVAVTSSNMTSGTLAVGDQVSCFTVIRP